MKYLKSITVYVLSTERTNKDARETLKEHDYIITKIDKIYTKNHMKQKIHCPIDEYMLSKNFIELSEEDKNDPYVILWELRNKCVFIIIIS